MGLFGDLVTDALGGFPTIPDAPPAPNVNPQTAQRESIAGNRAALPELEALAGDVNQFNLGQRQSMLRQNIPGYDKLTTGASDLLTGWLGGQLSPDVASAVRRNANARAVAGGYGGGGGSPLYGPSMKDTLTWRDLGLAADTGQTRAMGMLPGYLATVGGLGVPRQYDPVADFINPMQQVAAQQWNESNRYGRDWLQAQLESIPDPAQAAIAKDVGGMADAIGSMIPYFGAFYSMSQGGAGGGTGGGMRDIGMGGGGGGGGGIGGGWLESLFGGGGGAAMGGGAGAMGNIGGIGISGLGF